MSDNEKKSTFDELVAGISSGEREILLKRMNQNREQEISIAQPEKFEDSGVLEVKFKSEPILYKLFLYVRSFFTKKEANELYNEDLISVLSKRINKIHPGIIDIRENLILSLFYEKLKELKFCADFFKPYFVTAYENPGKFFVFLSTFVAPDIADKINSEADPFTIPFDREITTELRVSLLKRLDNLLKNIDPVSKEKLYSSVKGLEWLKRFSELPFIHFTAQFTAIVSSSYTCPYINAQADYPAFSKILSSSVPVKKEALQSLFLFSQKSGFEGGRVTEELENALHEFMNKAVSCFSSIQMFTSSVPVSTLGKVIFQNYDWQAAEFGGGEDWFLKFKEEWKCVFENRWRQWNHDKKKNQLAKVMNENFDVQEFPELKYKPWIKLWGGVPFRCELTAGLLSWFAENKFTEIMNVMNVIILEGQFINKDNRTLLSEAINDFVDLNQQVVSFVEAISPDGSIGNVFDRYIQDRVKTIKAQQLVSSILLNSENTMRTCARVFCNSTRTIENIFHGILDDEKDNEFQPLQNLMTLKGPENRIFRDKMAQVREDLNVLRSVLTEIEPLDQPVN